MSNEKSVAYREGFIAAEAGKELSFSNPYVLDSDPYNEFVEGFNSVPVKLVEDTAPLSLGEIGTIEQGTLNGGADVPGIFTHVGSESF